MPEAFWALDETCLWMKKKAVGPPLGLLTVAGLLPVEWECRLLDMNVRRVEEDDWDWADVVMITGIWAQKPDLLDAVREARRRGKIVVVGGPYATTYPDEVLAAGCDVLVKGEAENLVSRLVKCIEKRDRASVLENGDKPDLTISPVPRFDLLNFEDYVLLEVQTSRGCPHQCEFCSVTGLFGRKPRYKTPDQVIAELEVLYRLGWRRDVFFADDNFIGSRAHARAILEKLIFWMKRHDEPFSFSTQVSVELGHDREMIDLMTMANFANVFVGIESPDEHILAQSGKYHNLRNPLVESVESLCRNGLSVTASFVIGFDGEERGIGERICSFVDRTAVPLVMVNLLRAFPNTPLWSRLESEGRLLEERTDSRTVVPRLNYVPTRSESEIMWEYSEIYDYLYDRSQYLGRAYRYYLRMRPTRLAMAQKAGDRMPPGCGKRKPTFARESLESLMLFLHLCWRQGVRASTRRQYWRQLVGILRRNPSRVTGYLIRCGIAENMFRFKALIRERTAQINMNEDQSSSSRPR